MNKTLFLPTIITFSKTSFIDSTRVLASFLTLLFAVSRERECQFSEHFYMICITYRLVSENFYKFA